MPIAVLGLADVEIATDECGEPGIDVVHRRSVIAHGDVAGHKNRTVSESIVGFGAAHRNERGESHGSHHGDGENGGGQGMGTRSGTGFLHAHA